MMTIRGKVQKRIEWMCPEEEMRVQTRNQIVR
jgi:hypothetical protein